MVSDGWSGAPLVRVFFDPEGEGGSGEGGGQEGSGGEGGGKSLLGGDQGAGGSGEGGGQEGADPFKSLLETLPEDVKGHSALSKYESFEDLVRGHVNAQQLVGKDPNSLVELPADKTDLEAKKGVLQRMGLPENADGYEIKAGDGTPDFLKPDTELGMGFRQKAHELGVLPEQAQGLYEWFAGSMMEGSQTLQQQRDEAVEESVQALEKEFGQAFDQKVAAANHAVEKLGGKDLRQKLAEKGLDSDYHIVKAFAQMGESMGEDAGVSGEKGSRFGNQMTPAEATSRANELTRQANALEYGDPRKKELQNEAVRVRARARGETIDI